MRRLIPALAVLIAAAPVAAEDMRVLPYFGASPWGGWTRSEAPRWDGPYARASAGYSFTSFGKGASISGPTVGLEAGRYWRDGNWVHAAAIEADYMHSGFARFSRPGALPILSRDVLAAARIKSGYLVRPDLLVYGSVGVTGVNYTLHRPGGLGGGRDSEFVIRPDIRAGAIWAVTDNTTLTLEVGVRPALR